MKLKELKEIVDHLLEVNPRNENLDVVIPIEKESYGGTPSVNVKSLHNGIDWNNGKLFINPDNKLKIL